MAPAPKSQLWVVAPEEASVNVTVLPSQTVVISAVKLATGPAVQSLTTTA